MNMPKIRPMRLEWEEPLRKACEEDQGHALIAPTHVIWKGDEIAGYLSVAAVPVVLTWMHTQKIQARDSLMVMNCFENLVAASGGNKIAVPCMAKSPLNPFMEKLGYMNFGQTNFYMKPL